MLIPIEELSSFYQIQPSGVLHVGAHLAEEEKEYLKFNWDSKSKIYWVESQPELVKQLKTIVDPVRSEIIQSTSWGMNDIDLVFKVTNNAQSSSLLNLGTHKSDYPEVLVIKETNVKTERLDRCVSGKNFDFINIDIQGAELQALIGLGELIGQVKWIYLEINKKQVYENCSTALELDTFLEANGFRRIETRWILFKGWGDALYIKSEILEQLRLQKSDIRYRELKFYFKQILSILKSHARKKILQLFKS